MNHAERLAFTERIFEQCLDIMRTKGLSYASEGDASENFKRIAEASGMTKYQVWAVYFGKHVLSLNNAVKRNPDFPAVADGEPIAGRVADIINYAVLLAMMVQDDERAMSGEMIVRSPVPQQVCRDLGIEDDVEAAREFAHRFANAALAAEVDRTFGEPIGNGRRRKKK